MARKAKQELQNTILGVSFTLFTEKGYEKTTTREIAQGSGIERGLLHYYFRQKQDILVSLYDGFSQCVSRFAAERTRGLDAMSTLALSIHLYYKFAFEDDKILRILASVLSYRDTTHKKIVVTTNSHVAIAKADNLALTREQIYLANLVGIGSEVELLLNMVDGTIDMSPDILSENILYLTLGYLGYSRQEIDVFHERAVWLASGMDLSGFPAYMAESCSWYRP